MPSRPDPLPALWGRLRHLVVGVPFAWLLFFFALPFVILLRISITDMGEQLDPFASLLRTVNGQLGVFVQIQSFISLVRGPESGWFDTLYLDSYALSLKYAVFTTALCLFIGYPFAYFLARAARLPGLAAADGYAALLDLVFAARLRLERHSG